MFKEKIRGAVILHYRYLTLKMNVSSSRRSPTRAPSISSAISTPVSRRRNSLETSVTTFENTSANSATSTRTVRGLQSKSKTVKWTQSINNKSNSQSNNNARTNARQQQQLMIYNDESSMNTDHSYNEMSPSTIIHSLSLSHPKTNNNNKNDDTTIDSDSPIVRDEEASVNQSQDNFKAVITDPKTKQTEVKQAEILGFFDESQGGAVYV